jgi:hypothetical protein
LHSALEISSAGYTEHDGVRQFFRDLGDAWGGDIQVEPEAYFDLGDRTLAFHVLRGRGRHSGAEVAMPTSATVVRWREDLMVYFKVFAHREDALSDLGLSEDVLTPIEP